MYSPKIKDDLVRRLYRHKQLTNTPMTKLVNEAVVEYLRRKENGLPKDGSKNSR
jgi:hypothetical protein